MKPDLVQLYVNSDDEKKIQNSMLKKVMWYLDLPKGTKCSFVEAYNVDRESKSEILVQRGSELFINNMEYDFENHRWNIGATVEQQLKK